MDGCEGEGAIFAVKDRVRDDACCVVSNILFLEQDILCCESRKTLTKMHVRGCVTSSGDQSTCVQRS